MACEEATKKCSDCGKEKPLEDFCAYIKRGKLSRRSQCNECRALARRVLRTCSKCGCVKEYAGNFAHSAESRCNECLPQKAAPKFRSRPPDYKLLARNSSLKNTYGIGVAEYDLMLARQRRRCAICEKQVGDGAVLDVDHCHYSKKVRGLLCGSCNRGIGLLKDSPEILESAITYLIYWQHKHKEQIECN